MSDEDETPTEEPAGETEAANGEAPKRRRRPRLRRGGLPIPGRTFAATARSQTSMALWPHASRASLVLLGGGALLVAHIIWDPSHTAARQLGPATLNKTTVTDAQSGTARKDLISLGPALGGLVGLALFASISPETGTLALLMLLALWLGYLWLSPASPLLGAASKSHQSTPQKG